MEIEKKKQGKELDYDRLMRALGAEAMKKMQMSKVLVVGLSGLGVEIAKNLILCGINSIYLYDDKAVNWFDLSSNFYCTEHDVGSNRLDSVLSNLKQLNQYVQVIPVGKEKEIDEELLNKVDIAIFTDESVLSLSKMNELCRQTNTKFIGCETKGLSGCVFCDMGESFEVFDENGEPPSENTIIEIEKGNPTRIVCLPESGKISHGYYTGDIVTFNNVEGMEELNGMCGEVEIAKGTGRFSFFVKIDSSSFSDYVKQTGYCVEVKQKKTHNHLSLDESMKDPQVEEYDFGKFGWGKLYLFPLFQSLEEFKSVHDGSLPRSYNKEDADELLELVHKRIPNLFEKNEEKEESEQAKKTREKEEQRVKTLIQHFSFTCRGKLNPLAAFIGGFAAHEVLKGVSGRCNPLSQWFFFEALETLNPEKLPSELHCQPNQNRYDGQIAVFGRVFQNQLARKKVFLVGVGALGCEYLKNLALMGIGTKAPGLITITDMDSIEESNLNRQFLFRQRHVGEMKSKSASEVVKLMNPSIQIDALVDKVCEETLDVFNDPFWLKQDVIVNALDNIKAREFVDGKCCFYHKALVEAGTEGPKANTFIVVPKLTEPYSAQKDLDTGTHPRCTITDFPYKPVHSIVWAREKFEDLFCQSSKNVNSYLKENKMFFEKMEESKMNNYSKKKVLKEIKDNLVENKPLSFEDCVKWARLLFEDLFHHRILQLLHVYPLDMISDGGLKFWIEDKRPPTPLIFDPENVIHLEFIVSASNLRAEMYGLKGKRDVIPSYVKNVLEGFKLPEFVPRVSMIDDVDEQKKEEEDSLSVEDLIQELPKPNDLVGFELTTHVFEKDRDENFHVDFVTSASNCRCLNYKIPCSTKFEVKGIAGQIIPAMITSTSAVTGLGMIECLKILQGFKNIEVYRNAWMNLSIAYCSQAEPRETPQIGFGGSTHWDFFEVKMKKDVSVKEFLSIFPQKYKMNCLAIGYKGKSVYSDSYKFNEGELDLPMSEFVFKKSEIKPIRGQQLMRLGCTFESLDGQMIENPPDVKYQFKFPKKGKRKMKKKM